MGKFRESLKKVKKPLTHVKKVKHVRWLLPGWVLYEFYKVHKNMGHTKTKSLGHGFKAEAVRLAAMASLPIPGTYELTTTGLALFKGKIEKGEIERFSLRAFKDFTPLGRLKRNRENIRGKPYLRIFYRNKKICFEIFYKEK